ncbi:MAG: TRAP transporter large permease subunit [bacterium]
MAHDAPAGRGRLLASTLPALLLLSGVIVYSTFVLVYSQLSSLAESWYPGYHQLREEPAPPDCDATAAPAAAPPSEAPAAEGDDILGDLLGDEPVDAGAAAKAAEAARQRCQERWDEYKGILVRRTDGVKRFRSIERMVEAVRDIGLDYQRHALVLLFLICAATATALRQHIALRPARSRLDHRVAEGMQFLATVLLAVSVWAHKGVEEAAGARAENSELFWIWTVGFGVMAAINLHGFLRPPADAPREAGLARAFLSVPLYTTMCLVAGLYFLIGERHPAGLSIYLGKLPEFARLYLQVGLYVWIGMLLKRTRLAEMVFDLVRPWKLPPELLAFVVVVGAALPTAYSGASGIFVIAVGAVIYEELRRAGARRQLALAATAMSGSLGVVLRPCLLVVIVASLNKQVTTDQLYGWGVKVFLLTAVLFFLASIITKQGKLSLGSPKEALPGTGRALVALVPYVVIVAALLFADHALLDAHLDENWAPYLLPVILLLILVYDRASARRRARAEGAPRPDGFGRSVERATTETTVHIGALLLLMGLSICLGGIVERADLMSLVPETFGSTWTTMALLVGVLVIIGMLMDPYGAVILVSATIASVAYRNGIDPVHFWMVVLVAFELGYLTPPVALNHLLTRQVVGDDETEEGLHEGASFWRRHERVMLPATVMAIALLIVAFGPLFFYQ